MTCLISPGPDVRHAVIAPIVLDRSAFERLREQQALIEEARRRARRRRQRYAALALLGATVAVVVGFVALSGGDTGGLSRRFGPVRTGRGGCPQRQDRLRRRSGTAAGRRSGRLCETGDCALPGSPRGCNSLQPAWSPVTDVEPAWSPDGRQIALVRGDAGSPFGRSTFSLYLRDSEADACVGWRGVAAAAGSTEGASAGHPMVRGSRSAATRARAGRNRSGSSTPRRQAASSDRLSSVRRRQSRLGSERTTDRLQPDRPRTVPRSTRCAPMARI